MKELLNLIKNNAAVQDIIESHIYPTSTSYLGNCVLYEFHTIAADKKIDRIRLKLTLITDTIDNGVRLEAALKKAILTFGDAALTDTILKVVLNGGGTLDDDSRNMHHRILYFDILTRGEK